MRRMRPLCVWFALLLLVIGLAGCSGDGGASDAFDESQGDGSEQAGNRTDRSILPAATAVPQFGSGDAGALVMGFAASSDHPVAAQALIPFANQVNETTAGALTFEVFPDAQIAQNPGTFQSVVVGGQDIGWGVQALTAGRFPATSVIELPYAFDSAVAATDALWTLYDEFAEIRNEYLDVKVLGLWVQDPGIIWSTQGPIATADDLEPMAIGVPGPLQNDLIEGVGSIPAPLLPSEVAGAFLADEISGVLSSSSTIQIEGLDSAVEGAIDCRCYVGAEFLVMNLDAWDSLTAEQQTTIEQFSGRQLSMQVAGLYDGLRTQVAQAVVAQGATITTVDAAAAPWSTSAGVVIDNWIAAGADTRIPTQAIYDRMTVLAGS